MYFQNIDEYFEELDKSPGDNNIITEDGNKWLKQDYAINRMNEIYGEGNWAIEKIRKSELKNENGQSFGYACVVSIGYKHQIGGDWIVTDGVSGTDSEIDNNIIGRAMLNAISHLGRTFGQELSAQFE